MKLIALAAVVVSVWAFLFEGHAMIWLVAAVLPGAAAVLLGARQDRQRGPHSPDLLHPAPDEADVDDGRAAARYGGCAR